jgi:hypothetical protein
MFSRCRGNYVSTVRALSQQRLFYCHLFTKLLLGNRSTSHIAPSLRLLIPILNAHFPNPDGRLGCKLDDVQHYSMSQRLVDISPASQSLLLCQASVPYAVVAFLLRLTSLLERPLFRGSSYNIILGPPFPWVAASDGRSLILRSSLLWPLR